MLKWALFFLVITVIAGFLSFTIAIAQILFFIFLVIFLALFATGLFIRRKLAEPDVGK